MSWSKHERSLSRFVREIPRPFLKFNNVTSFKLSTNEAGAHMMSVEDMIRGFDGEDWSNLREENSVPLINTIQTDSIYNFAEMFSIPEWVKQNDIRDTWIEMLRWVTLRECAIHMNTLKGLETPEIKEALLTIRIYKEDLDFWEQYEVELEHLVYKFLQHTKEMPSIEYYQLSEYVKKKLPHLSWNTQEMSHALVILSKIRGQLRPLRHGGFNLDDFSFGCVRNSVPTELRPLVLKSWHNIINPLLKSHDIIIDIWRIASIKSILEGRNIPLYQGESLKDKFKDIEFIKIIMAIENAIPNWLTNNISTPITLNFIFEAEDIKAIHFDILTSKAAYYIYFDPQYVPSMEDKILLLLKQYAYEEIYDRCLESIGFFNMATGMIIKYEITALMREQMSRIWQHLQRKYLGF
jgi:hypothetical protein